MSHARNAASGELFQRANFHLPGGVNSPVRAFKSVGGTPPFIESGTGAHITDFDGNTYIDYVMSYGPLLLGHAPAVTSDAICNAAHGGTVFGAPTAAEVEIAELVSQLVPSIEMIRFVSSGSEATTSAIRLARGATGRDKIVKCSGCFHGSVDSLLVSAGSGAATLAIPATAGVPPSFAAETIVVPYNDAAALEQAFAEHSGQIAAFIVEPVAANMGVVPPVDGYLQAARDLTKQHGAILIYDEVITGFRLGPAGAQGLFGVQPDLTCFGKIIGGGVPCGAYGGRRDLMEQLAPLGPVYQAGTLSGNPLAMAAGLAMLSYIQAEADTIYLELDRLGRRLAAGLKQAFDQNGIPCTIQRVGSILTPFFTDKQVRNYDDATTSDTAAFASFFHRLLGAGIYIAPSQFEAWFVSTAHTDELIDRTIKIVEEALA